MDKKTLRLNLILCSILHGLNHYLLIFYKPMYPLMAGYFGLDNVADVTTRLTIAYAGYGIANFLTGILARRINLKYILFGGMLLMSLATAAMALIPSGSYGVFVFLAFLMGLGGGTYHPAANTLMTSLHEEKHGHAIGVLSIGSAVGFITAPLVGARLGNELLGFQPLFLISGLAAFLYAWLFLFFLRGVTSLPHHHPDPGKRERVFPKKILILIIVFLAVPTVIRDIINWGYFEITPYWVLHGFSHGIGVDWIQLMAYLPGLVVQPLAGKLCDRLKPLTVVVGTFALTSVGHILLGFNAPGLAWTGLVLYGAGLSAATVANETYMASLVSARSRGLVYGIVLSLALGVGGYLGGSSGWIVDAFGKTAVTGYRIWFIGMGLINAAAISCYAVIERLRTGGKREGTETAAGITAGVR